MGKIIVFTNLTLDGVMQAPARPDEDTRGGFEHGGWAKPYEAMQQSGEVFANVGGLLFGRRTYEDFYNVWHGRTDNQFTEFFDNVRKYVVSTTLEEPLPWDNSALVGRDVAETLERLKARQEKDLLVFGSGLLAQSLLRWKLVDEYVLLIHPLVLGSGRRLFPEDGTYAALTLRGSKTTDKGVVILTYQPADGV